MSDTPLLTLEDIAVARGGMDLLSGVSCKLHAGQAIVLRGANGIGKTTLLRTIARLQPPRVGRVEAALDSIAYAGHADGVKPTLSVIENLTFWAEVYQAGNVHDAIEAFALEPLQDRLAGNLSAGQRRRLGLARLMVTGRAVWLLDEPTVSLDAEGVAQFAATIRAHLTNGGATMIATHIDLGLGDAPELDLTPYRAALPVLSDFDEAFL